MTLTMLLNCETVTVWFGLGNKTPWLGLGTQGETGLKHYVSHVTYIMLVHM